MTNTLEQPKKKNNFAGLLITLLTIGCVLGFSVVFYIAYNHSDGTAYSIGCEMGCMFRRFIEARSFKNGIRLGSIIAVLASWERCKSIRWAILHAVFGWAYVIYFVLTRKSNEI